MKKVLLFMFAALAMITTSASAQSASVYVGYGAYTQMDAMDMHDNWAGVKNAWGALNAGVDFNFGRFHVGPSYTFSSTTATVSGFNPSHIYYHVIMLNAKYDYYRTGILTLYAHLGLGAEISHMVPKMGENYNEGYFAFQAVPIGARVDLGSNFDVFGELGFGAQGLFQLGFAYNF